MISVIGSSTFEIVAPVAWPAPVTPGLFEAAILRPTIANRDDEVPEAKPDEYASVAIVNLDSRHLEDDRARTMMRR
jgi:hypothetical protein